jgi:cysteine-rich repeat protein
MRRSAGLVAVAIVLGVGPAHAWRTAVTDTPPNGRPTAVAVDADDTIIAVGRTPNPAGDEDALAVALAGHTGVELWQHRVAGGAAKDDVYQAVAARDGLVVGVGRVSNPLHEGDALMTRFGQDGSAVWEFQLDGPTNLEDAALAVAIDSAGGVFVVGQTEWATSATTTATRFTVWKRLGENGGELWLTTIPDALASTARAVTTAGTDAVAAGNRGPDLTVARFDGTTGAVLWQKFLAGSAAAPAVAQSVAEDAGRVVVGGRLPNPAGDPDFAVVAFDAVTGTELWRTVIDGTQAGDNDQDEVTGVAIDGAGDVLAVGRLSNATTDDDAVAVKLAGATGAELWRTVVDGPASNNDVFEGLALDDAGDLLVTGTLRSRNRDTRADFLVGKLANATGAELWRATLDGTDHLADTGTAVAAAPDGDLVAVGRLRNGVDDGFTVTRRAAQSGGDFPCGDGLPNPGELCDDGNPNTGDGCRPDCTPEVCGDGIKDPQEQCDGGLFVTDDCCTDACTLETDGTTCSDNDACTTGDACQAGICTPVGKVTCTPLSPCHLALCDSATGACSSPPKAEGAPCTDGNACTVLDQCIGGACTGTQTLVCNDGDPCTSDSCTPAFGCTFTPVTGFESISCTFRRGRIEAACGTGLPNQIDGRIRKAKGLVAKAALTQDPVKARKPLKIVLKNLKKALRVALARRDKEKLDFGCASVLEAEINDIMARATAVRDQLGT